VYSRWWRTLREQITGWICLSPFDTSLYPSGHPKHRNINKMKRQRNTQQVKEQDKCPPNQKKRKR